MAPDQTPTQRNMRHQRIFKATVKRRAKQNRFICATVISLCESHCPGREKKDHPANNVEKKKKKKTASGLEDQIRKHVAFNQLTGRNLIKDVSPG